MNRPTSRRALLAATAGSIALAGCLDGNGESTETDEVDTDIDWQAATLEDVTTGESFTIAEIDRPVVIHTFAPFCPTCNDHQDGVSDQYDGISNRIEFVDLVVDGNDDPEHISSHAEDNGHEWRFGVAPEAFTSALVDEFGQDVAVHAQSPLIIVCPEGATETIEKPASISTIRNAVDSRCQ